MSLISHEVIRINGIIRFAEKRLYSGSNGDPRFPDGPERSN